MIDQRVSESIQSPFFGKDAYTTTIPAQFVKKFKCKVVPIYIERKNNVNFEVTVYTPLNFEEKETINEITQKLNKNLEQMILLNPQNGFGLIIDGNKLFFFSFLCSLYVGVIWFLKFDIPIL